MVVLFPPYDNWAIFYLLLLLGDQLGGSGKRQVPGTALPPSLLCWNPIVRLGTPLGSVRSARGTGGSPSPVSWSPAHVLQPLTAHCFCSSESCWLTSTPGFSLARLWISSESPEIGRVWCFPCARSTAQHRKQSEGLAGCWRNKWLWTRFWILNSCSF